MTEQFYSSIAALTQSPQSPQSPTVYAEREATDPNTWLMDQLQPRVGDSILNIGCSNGKQADRSYRALSVLSQRSQEQGLEHRIRFLYLNLDELTGHLRPDDFDRALSARALSHVKQPQVVFHAIYEALKPGGVFFFYGPSRKDLVELRLFIAALDQEKPPQENKELLFIEKIGLPHVRDVFPQVEITQFENPLLFNSPDDLFARWYESALYEEELENAFRRAAVRHFQSHAVFETAQRFVGVRATKA